MEKLNKTNNSSRLCTGLVILAVGLVFFLDNIGLDVPDWLISWPMAMIAIGLLIGFKRKFNGGPWVFFIVIGGFFIAESILHLDLSKYYFALIFILIGTYLILKPKSSFNKGRFKRKFAKDQAEPKTFYDIDKNDILDSTNVFGGSHQNIYSKNFKGGDAIAIFGGADINLTQADFNGTIVLDVLAIFGGIKIIIPPSWEVKSEVTAIFGGIDDKRALGQVVEEPRKMIIIKGVALFGGVDIRNF